MNNERINIQLIQCFSGPFLSLPLIISAVCGSVIFVHCTVESLSLFEIEDKRRRGTELYSGEKNSEQKKTNCAPFK